MLVCLWVGVGGCIVCVAFPGAGLDLQHRNNAFSKGTFCGKVPNNKFVSEPEIECSGHVYCMVQDRFRLFCVM